MSPVREALIGVFEKYHPEVNWRAESPSGGNLLDDLTAAVEAVPVQVTIRDLDMADDENVVTVSGEDVEYLARVASVAAHEAEDLHVTVDAGYLKMKVGGFSWTPPIETQVYNP